MHSVSRPADNEGQDPRDAIPRLQKLLSDALLAREWAVNRVLELEAMTDGHWFVPDEGGAYCAACNLPRRNRRHIPRPNQAA